MQDKLTVFVNRMKKLNIDIKLSANYPWIYIQKINNQNVTEKHLGNHGFTIAFAPIDNSKEIEFTDISKIFELIRNYCEKQRNSTFQKNKL